MNRQLVTTRHRSKSEAFKRQSNRSTERPTTVNAELPQHQQQRNVADCTGENKKEDAVVATSKWLQPTSVFWTKWGNRVASDLTWQTMNELDTERQARVQSARTASEDTIYSSRSGRQPKHGQWAEEAGSSDTDLSMLSCSDIDEDMASKKKQTVRVRRRSKLPAGRQRSINFVGGVVDQVDSTLTSTSTQPTSATTDAAHLQSNASVSPTLQSLQSGGMFGSKTAVIKRVTLNDEERELLRQTLRASSTGRITRERSASIENIRELHPQLPVTGSSPTTMSKLPTGRKSKNSNGHQKHSLVSAKTSTKAIGPEIVFLKTRRRSLDSRTAKEKVYKPANLRTRSSDYRSRTPIMSVWGTVAVRTLDQTLADDTSINKIIRHGQTFLRQHPVSVSLDRYSDGSPARENYTKITTYPRHLHLSLPLRDVIADELDMIIANKRPIAVNTQLLQELDTTNMPLGRSYRNHVLFNWMNALQPPSLNKLPYSAKF